MKNIPGDLKFLSSHEWARVESDGTITIGISDHAQDLLGDIVFVELPEVGQTLDAETDAAIVESVKAASDVYSPLSGEIMEQDPAFHTALSEVVDSASKGKKYLRVVKAITLTFK